MNRRNFVLALAGSSILVAFGCSGFLGSREQVVTRILRTELHWLSIDEDSIARFAADFAKYSPYGTLKVVAVDLACRAHRYVPKLVEKLDPRVPLHKNRVATLFLRSSDFFANGSDESRTVQYVRWFDPYMQPCRNPFARLG